MIHHGCFGYYAIFARNQTKHMKKIIFFCFILLSVPTFAQKKFAVFGGVNNSFFAENKIFGAMNVQPTFGKQVGALYNMPLSGKISFRPKLMYSEQGDRSKHYGNYITPSAVDYKLSYINVAADFKFWKRIYVIAGPQIGFLLNYQPQTILLDESPKTIDLGVNLGIGFTIHDWFFEFGGYTALSPVLVYENRWGKTDLYNAHSKFTFGYHIF